MTQTLRQKMAKGDLRLVVAGSLAVDYVVFFHVKTITADDAMMPEMAGMDATQTQPNCFRAAIQIYPP